MKKMSFLLLIIASLAYGAQAPMPKLPLLVPKTLPKKQGLSAASLEKFQSLANELKASKIPKVNEIYQQLQKLYEQAKEQQIYITSLNLQLNTLISKLESPEYKDIKFESATYNTISLGSVATLIRDTLLPEIARTVSLFGISQQTINYFHDIINALPGGKSVPVEVNTIKTQLMLLDQAVQEKTISLDELLTRLMAISETIKTNPAYMKITFENPPYGRLTLGQFADVILGSLIDHIQNRVGLLKFTPTPAKPSAPVAPPPSAAGAQTAPQRQPSPPLAQRNPHGLANIGNSCFMNASLQNLYALDELSTELLKRLNGNYYPPNSFADEYINFINSMRTSSQQVLEPRAVCMRGWQRMGFAPLSQQDNDEFINFLLGDLLKDSADPLRKLIEIRLQTFFTPPDPQLGEPKPTSEFLLSVPATKAKLEENIRDFFAVEKGVERGYPKQPGGPVPKVDKQEKIVSTGKYLMIHLKRNVPQLDKNNQVMFDANDQMILKKLAQPISFPITNLNLNAYAIPGVRLPLYHLRGIVIHAGSARGGHYTGYVRYGNQWYFVNDSQVAQVTQQEIERIANQGYGSAPDQTPTTFFYGTN